MIIAPNHITDTIPNQNSISVGGNIENIIQRKYKNEKECRKWKQHEHLKLLCASDGSYKDGIAAYEYCIAKYDRTTIMQGGGKCNGRSDNVSSYGAEVVGALALSYAIT